MYKFFKITICTLLFFTGSILFADELSPELQDEPKTETEEPLFTENLENDNSIIPELQENLTIITTQHRFNLDPHTASYNAEAEILTGLYEGLFSYDPITLEPLYALCKEYRISRDKKRWTFTIRDNAKFSDGTEITSEDVRTSWLSLLKNPNASFSSLFDIVKGAQEYRKGKLSEDEVGIYTTDLHSITIHLIAPASHLPRLLCMPCFAVKPEKPFVYSGPFTMEDFTRENIILCRNEHYHDVKNVPLKQITFILSDDISENTFLFNTGACDWVTSQINLGKLLSKNTTHITAEFATEYLFFKKGKKNSIWNNKEFREALLEAVPWEKLRENSLVKAKTFVYPLSGYPLVQGYEFSDIVEASNLMKQARTKCKIPADKKLEIIFAVRESERMENQAELLKNAWAPLGVELKTVAIDADEYLNLILETEADLFSFTWIGDYADPLAFLELFRGESTLNVSGWNNEEYNNLLIQAQLFTDENHVKLLAQAEQVLLDDAVVIPIQHPVSLNVIDLSNVGGWAQNSFDLHPLKYLFKKKNKLNVPNLVLLK